MKEPVYVVDIFRDIVEKVSEAVAPNIDVESVQYLVGHYVEIKDRLLSQSKSKLDSFPLIALFQDFVETRGGEYYATANLQIMILHNTSKIDYVEDRYEKVFKPILYPIYEELLKQISKKAVVYGPNKIQHDKIDRPHWGNPKMYGNEGYIFDFVLDGIELRNLKFTLKQNCI